MNNDTGFITQGNISSVSDGKNVLVNAWASSITATEVDGQTPSFVILHNSNPTLFSKQPIVSYPEGSLSFTTRLGSSGTASIDVILQQANDGEFIPSEIVSFDIVIESELINLAPEFSLGNDLIIEDSSHAFEQANWLTVAHDGNDSDQQLTFDTIENSSPNLFVVEPWISYPSRTLRFTPVPGSIGTAIITIRAQDNGGTDNGGVDTSEHQTFRITFLEQSSNINHHPEFVVGEDITVMRNSADFERKAWVNSVSDGDDDTQPLHFVISANDSPHLFTDQPWVSYPSKTLRFTPKAGVTGTAILSIYVRETHGNLRSSTQTFKIHIVANSQNLSPTFTLGPNVVVAMNSGDAAFPAWATKIDDANHGNGKIVFEIVSVEKPYLFSEQPNISIPSGTLRFRPADNEFGMSHVSVRLKDLNDPQASSETVTFSITIKAPQETNRAPVASAGSHTLQESSSITFALQASDEDGDSLIYKITDAPNFGSIVLEGRLATYTPHAGHHGADSFTFEVSDGSLLSNKARIELTIEKVLPTNTPPVAITSSHTLKEDSQLNATLLASDKENDSLTYTIVIAPTHGTLTGHYPSFTYTPTANYNGEDSFGFQANDAQDKSNTAMVSLQIDPHNDAPIAFSSSFNLTEEAAVVFTLSANDPDGDALQYTIQQQPLHGVLEGTAPLLTYTPNKDYSGKDKLVFVVNDSSASSATATVSFTIIATNDAPIVKDRQLTTPEDGPLDIILSGYDSDDDPLTLRTVTPPMHGKITEVNGLFRYTPNLNFNGSDSFSYKANDGKSDSNLGVVQISVTAKNDPPVAIGKTLTTPSLLELRFELDASDVENDSLSWSIVSNPSNGSVSLTGSGIRYISKPGFIGLDTLSFQVDDGTSHSNIATISIDVGSDSNPPKANNQHYLVVENETLSIITSGSDIDNDPLTYKLFSSPSHGTLQGNLPNVTYTPNRGYVGNDRFIFASNDGTSDSAPGFITLTVQSTNDAPLAIDGAGSTLEDTELNITLDAYDQDGDPLDWSIVTAPQHGTLSGFLPELSYIPNTDYTGYDELSFTVSDGDLQSTSGLFQITVNPSNDQAIAHAQRLIINEDEALDITLGGSDKEQDSLSYELITTPAFGSISGSPPQLRYTPQQGFFGVESFSFRVNDGTSDSEPASVTIEVLPINDRPIATPQVIKLDEDSSSNILLTATDPEGDQLNYQITSQPTIGTLTGNANNWVYTPQTNYSGTDSFEFIANDGELDSIAALVTFEIRPLNDEPSATNAQYSIGQSQLLTLTLTGLDPENTPLDFAITAPPLHGELNGEGNQFVYTPNKNFSGDDSLQFKVDDGVHTSSPATISITVLPTANTAPIADAGNDRTTAINNAITISGEHSSDNDNDPLNYQWTIKNKPENSYATLSNTESMQAFFTPDIVGTYEISLLVNDGHLDSLADNLTITATKANKRPIADAGSARTISIEQTVTLSASNSYDPEGEALNYQWEITTQPDNSSYQISSPVSIEPLFKADTLGDYTLSLIVNDGVNNSIADEVIITLSSTTQVNHKPIAAPQYSIGINDFEDYVINLDASNSSDQDGDILSYHWTLLSQHQQYNTIPDSESMNLIWSTAPDNQRIQLIVNDGELDSDPVVIDIAQNASMTPMFVFDDEPRLVNTGDEVGLEIDAWDYDSDITFSWRILTKPDGSLATVDSPNDQFTTFIADVAGLYTIEIEVSDGSPSGVIKRTVDVLANTAANTAPEIIIDNVADIILGQSSATVQLDASNSHDIDGDTLNYFWKLSAPELSHARLSDQRSASPKFEVDLPGEYNVELFLNDGYTQVDSDIAIHVRRETNTRPVASAGADQSGHTGAMITLDGSASYDDEGDGLTYHWKLLNQPANSSIELTAAESALQQPTYYPTEAGQYTFSLLVSDWTSMSHTDTVTVTITIANKAPSANTGQTPGNPSIVTTLDTVQLDASNSSDPENSPLSYLWAVDSSPTGSTAKIAEANSLSTSFSPDKQGRYRLKLVVNDGELDSQYAFFTIWAYNSNNQAPIAIAEDPISSFIDTVIQLNGSAAYDPDGDQIASRRWQVLVGPSGAKILLVPPYGENPIFQADRPGFYLLGYAVGDGELTSDTAFQRINLIGPTPPEANAGNDKTGTVDRQITFDAGNSSDADGDKLSYSWSVLSQPAASQFTLQDSDKRVMKLTADTTGSYTLQVEVTDGYTTDTDSVLLTLENNKAPTAVITVSNPIDPYVTKYQIQLDASHSTDPEADQLSYNWKLLAEPVASNTRIIDYNHARKEQATLSTYIAGNYTVELTANDGEHDSVKVIKTFSVMKANILPIASVDAPSQISRGKLSTLDASPSSDEDNDPLSYQWSLVSSPANSSAGLIGANSVQADFTPDLEGEYQIQLVVNDGKAESHPLYLTITSVDDNKQPEAYASYSHAVIVGDKVSISGWASDDEDGDQLNYFWTVTQKPASSQTSLDNDAIMVPTFTVDQAGSYTFQLVVNDGLVNSAAHSITITAVADNVGLPYHPGELGKQTLLGIDADNDGVRDDIQRHIYASYPAISQENLRLALTEMAKTYQTILWEAMDPSQAYGNAIAMGFHQECLAYLISDGSHRISTKLKSETLDTKDRFDAYIAYDNSLGGEIFPTSKIEDFKNSCSFELK